MTHYEVLGVDEGADDTTIQLAYRRRARDIEPQPGEKALQALVRAFETLRDPARRAAYDAELRAARAPVASAHVVVLNVEAPADLCEELLAATPAGDVTRGVFRTLFGLGLALKRRRSDR